MKTYVGYYIWCFRRVIRWVRNRLIAELKDRSSGGMPKQSTTWQSPFGLHFKTRLAHSSRVCGASLATTQRRLRCRLGKQIGDHSTRLAECARMCVFALPSGDDVCLASRQLAFLCSAHPARVHNQCKLAIVQLQQVVVVVEKQNNRQTTLASSSSYLFSDKICNWVVSSSSRCFAPRPRSTPSKMTQQIGSTREGR